MKPLLKNVFELITAVSPKTTATLLHLLHMKRLPNLKNPSTLSEKLTWLKLNTYANDKIVSSLADKYSVREYVKSKNLSRILNPLLGVYDSVDDINIDTLPDRFALKGVHGCGFNIIINNKSDIRYGDIVKTANKWLGDRYGLASAELHYLNIKPRLVIEDNISDHDGSMPLEFKIWCFDGRARVIQVSPAQSDERLRNYFDTSWNELLYSKPENRHESPTAKPKNLKQILNIADTLAEPFQFVRVDLYVSDSRVIFGELTFTPAAGTPSILSAHGNSEMGKMLRLENAIKAR